MAGVCAACAKADCDRVPGGSALSVFDGLGVKDLMDSRNLATTGEFWA